MTKSTSRYLAAVCAALVLALEGSALAQESSVEMSNLSGAPGAPRHHFRLRGAAELAPREAQSIYEVAVGALEIGYARSGLDAAVNYRAWGQYNSAPYLSATHGRHMVNNYANPVAASRYGSQDSRRPMPVGAVLAKDSFAVTTTRGILLGPLFVMEKMPAGFDAAFGDWKYSMVLPDGTLLGETGGAGSARVEYCIGCHAAVQDQDYLYYVPEGYRR